MKVPLAVLVPSLALFATVASIAHAADAPTTAPVAAVPPFWVRPGFKVTVAVDGLSEARFLEFDDKGTLYLSMPGKGTILALTDPDGDGKYAKRTEFVTGKDTCHGMQWVGTGADGWLWFTTSGGVFKARDTDGDGKADDVVQVLKDLPEGGGHNLRSICVDGDHFFTSIGSSENLAPEEAETTDRQKIWRYNLDGSAKTLFVSGIRNTEKLRIQPGTHELWGCDHGSDWFGKPYGEDKAVGDGLSKQAITDVMPPEEFNHYTEGGFYGHPWIVGDRVPRLEYKDRPDIATLAAKTIPPAYKGGAHWANNGWSFTTKDAVGTAGDAYIAYHGSWNDSKKVGYRVQRVLFDPETKLPFGGYPMVITLGNDDGTVAMDGQKVLGRPCDVAEAPDGSLLFSDTGAPGFKPKVYRITKAN